MRSVTKAVATSTLLAASISAHAQVNASPGLEQDWWRDAVFYNLFVRSFNDSRTGPLAGDGVGDLQGVIEKLDYLNDGDPTTTDDLGITGIWLLPIKQSPSYHGYDIVDYRTIDDEYGTNEDFKRLIEECEKRGIGVIVDLVLNHCSSAHPWFIEASRGNPEYRDWFVWHDNDPGWRGPWNQQVWHQSRVAGAVGDQYYYGLFWHGMPDLNFENPAVGQAALDISRYWIEEMGAAGFRLDAIRHLIEDGQIQESTPATIAWLEGYRDNLDALGEEFSRDVFSVGEVWGDTEEVRKYIPDALTSAFEFSLASDIVNTLRNDDRDATDLKRRIELVRDSYPPNTVSTFISNHDQNRFMSDFMEPGTIEPSKKAFDRAKAAATILLTLPGVPFLYYGEEIGMTGTKPDPEIRTPMQWRAESTRSGFTTGQPWKPVNPNTRTVNVATQSRVRASLLNRYRTLIHLRDEHPALATGSITTIETGDPRILAYLRANEDESILVLVNVSGNAVTRYGATIEGMNPSERIRGTSLLGGVVAPATADEQGTLTWRPRALAASEAEVILIERAD